jgi:hypothetical protein
MVAYETNGEELFRQQRPDLPCDSRSSRAAIAALAGPAYAFCMTFALLKAIALFAPYGSRQATRRSGSGSARA